MPQHYYRVLTIAGSDSGGGAGIQADLKTFSALGCFGMSAITALTAQNTLGVHNVFPIPPAFVREQIETVIEDIGVDAIKIGMLHSAEMVTTVADTLKSVDCPIILDPVMFAKNGCALLSLDSIEVLRTTLLPLATLITPNIPEAEQLTGLSLTTIETMQAAAIMIQKYGAKSVLIKGGHSVSASATDLLYHNNVFQTFSAPKVNTKNTHGTGCTLSAAIAAFLAQKTDLPLAVNDAKQWLTKAIISGSQFECGNGHGPVNHLFREATHA